QNPDVRIAITAPTGKAAERLNESVSDENEDIEAITLHKLLGAGFNGEFKFNKDNKLFHDIVIVDEASMLDLRMWIGLIRALKKSARLIVLGDKDQLSSVEAGSVLGDICFKSDNTFSNQTLELLKNNGLSVTGSNSVNNLNDNIVLLNKTYRSKESTGIPQLASAINEQDFESIDGILEGSEHIDIVQPTSSVLSELIQTYSNEKIKGLNETQFLCSNKRGVFGTEHLNLLIENKIKDTLRIPSKIEWFEGRRILVTKNDAINGISNGEIGTCVQRNDGSLVIKFGENKEVEPLELKSFDLAYAITVHKSQGSEFRNVCIFLPEVFNPVLSKELLYTSVTRAKESALVIGDRELIKQIINTEIKRTSSISIKLSRNDLQK
ncbi:MAG TPA: exodeoxyribonuclease V subunit alpha, partial [Balneola sp.]|nr:exodeoxyribonuclease V subunit alpha [Balneola sp.]